MVLLYFMSIHLGMSFGFLLPLLLGRLWRFDANPGQLMPLVWRVYLVVEKITASWSERVTLADLCRCYEFKKKEIEKVTIYKRDSCAHLVEGANVNDRGWKGGYLFMEKAYLGEAGSFFRDGCHSAGFDCN